MYLFILFPIAYLIGSIPFGLLLAKISGHGDIRKIGSGNIGATNVLRTGNKFLALLTLLLDASKGIAAIALLHVLPLITYHASCPSIGCMPPGPCGGCWSAVEVTHALALITGACAILGHCFPVWLKFKGGKGVATTLGVLLIATPWAGVLALVTWGIVAGFSRLSSMAALSAIAFAPVVTFIYYGPMPAIITALIAALVFWRHKDNIQRLCAGTEPKIGEKKKINELPPQA